MLGVGSSTRQDEGGDHHPRQQDAREVREDGGPMADAEERK
jgi:hypothetical protein